MIKKNFRQELEFLSPNAVLLDNPSFDNSIVGISDNGAVIYDYDSMIEEMMKDDNVDSETAMEYIDYNTLRAIPYMASAGEKPIILYRT